MRQRNKTVTLALRSDKIEKAIQELHGAPFSIKVIESTCGLRKQTVSSFLQRRICEGSIRKIGYGIYQQVNPRIIIKKVLPPSFVADKTWEVLVEANNPLALCEIVEKTEEKAGERNLSIYHPVSSLLTRWHSIGALERTGKRCQYLYERKTGVIERPAATRYYKVYNIQPSQIQKEA